ncbi:ribonuclease 1-like [Vigna radiata var. radiata]|uniref:Ribonuclease 1-like n=1 Tax=Vigna radiata var. radiata TaxID=3916 RepID=A0A1S3VAZ2_VIGRR|nr:ribonuclease 1-like [Vigna radiata var. radiata]
MSLVFVLSLFLLLEVPKSCSAYEYFKLTQTWPKGYCDKQLQEGQRTCKIIPKKFIIHGLWPEPHANAENGSVLSEHDIKPVEKELKLDWPSLNGHNLYLWKGEWSEHGVISEHHFPKLEYFKLALEIYKKNDMFDILKKEKVVPKPKELYARTSILEAVKKHTEHDAQVECFTDSKKNVSSLYEIRICLTADGSSYRDCPNPHGNCGDELLYPK